MRLLTRIKRFFGFKRKYNKKFSKTYTGFPTIQEKSTIILSGREDMDNEEKQKILDDWDAAKADLEKKRRRDYMREYMRKRSKIIKRRKISRDYYHKVVKPRLETDPTYRAEYKAQRAISMKKYWDRKLQERRSKAGILIVDKAN